MICGRTPLALALLSVCVEAKRAPAAPPSFGPAPPPPGLAKTDFHLLAELESHWLAALVLACSLAFIIEHRPAHVFGKPKVRDLKAADVPSQQTLALKVAEKVVPLLQSILHGLTPVAKVALDAFIWLIILLSPLIRLVAIAVWHIFRLLPKNILRMIYGLVLCFFGGTFVTTLSAAEAFNTLGGQRVIPDFKEVIEVGYEAWKASSEEGHKGIENVKGKTHAAMKAIKDPQKFQTSIGACVAISMAVLSTLRFEFAKTTALAMGIVSIVKGPMVRLFGRPVGYLLPDDLDEKWVETVIDLALKSVALALAWYIQMGISAFYSGIRGGTLFTYGLMSLLHLHKHGKQAGEEEATYLDELLGYPLAAYGFYWQVTNWFHVPYPWNIVLLPIETAEWALRWTITYSNAR